MWMVWDKEEGLVCTGDYDFCLQQYSELNVGVKGWMMEEEELSEDDLGYQVILAKIGQSLGFIDSPEGFELKETKEEIN